MLRHSLTFHDREKKTQEREIKKEEQEGYRIPWLPFLPTGDTTPTPLSPRDIPQILK